MTTDNMNVKMDDNAYTGFQSVTISFCFKKKMPLHQSSPVSVAFNKSNHYSLLFQASQSSVFISINCTKYIEFHCDISTHKILCVFYTQNIHNLLWSYLFSLLASFIAFNISLLSSPWSRLTPFLSYSVCLQKSQKWEKAWQLSSSVSFISLSTMLFCSITALQMA